MSRYQSATAYRSAAADGATQIGLLTLAYDGLARDLNKAAEAVLRNDIPSRCNASNRALLLLGHLETWIQYLDDATLAASLSQFYSMLRGQILHLQQRGKTHEFEALAKIVLETRAAWQRKEQLLIEDLSNRSSDRSFSCAENESVQPTRSAGWSA